jgi:hypothetical protein
VKDRSVVRDSNSFKKLEIGGGILKAAGFSAGKVALSMQVNNLHS